MSASGQRKRPRPRRWTRLDVPALPPKLTALDADGLRAQSDHTDVELIDLDLTAEHLTGLSLETVRVKRCCLDAAELRRVRCRRVVFQLLEGHADIVAQRFKPASRARFAVFDEGSIHAEFPARGDD